MSTMDRPEVEHVWDDYLEHNNTNEQGESYEGIYVFNVPS